MSPSVRNSQRVSSIVPCPQEGYSPTWHSHATGWAKGLSMRGISSVSMDTKPLGDDRPGWFSSSIHILCQIPAPVLISKNTTNPCQLKPPILLGISIWNRRFQKVHGWVETPDFHQLKVQKARTFPSAHIKVPCRSLGWLLNLCMWASLLQIFIGSSIFPLGGIQVEL